MEELKPCPFCGGKGKFVDVNGFWCVVICDKCNATSNSIQYSSEYTAKEKAIEAWNRRIDNG